MRRRMLLIVLVSLASATVCTVRLLLHGDTAINDFWWAWHGARLWLVGENPYAPGFYPPDAPLFYPFPALLVALPFALFPFVVASSLFVATITALLMYGLTKERWHQIVPLLLSAPFWLAVLEGQWSPLVVAAGLTPMLAPLALAKPSIGVPVILTLTRWKSWLLCGLVFLVSLVLLPGWPLDWIANLDRHNNFIPLLTPPGFLLLAALLRWRSTNAQLLLLLSIIPQRIYDPLALWLIPGTAREGLILSVASWLALLLQERLTGTPTRPIWIVVCFYLPVLAMLFRERLWSEVQRLRRGRGEEAVS